VVPPGRTVTITAPVAGRMGKDELTIGNLVRGDAPDSPRLSTLVALDPIYVSFEADEAAYLKYIGKDRNVGLKVQVGLANEEGTPHAATLQFVDNQINMASGTVRLRAELPNPDRRFTPGLYARVRLAGGSGTRRVVMVQDSAVGTDQSKRFVLVLDANKSAQYREIKIGRAIGALRVVDSGLKVGEQIVIDGLQRVRPGSPVTPSVVEMAPADASAAPVSAAPVAPSKDTPAATAETPAAKANAADASAEAPLAAAAAPKAAAETPEPSAEAQIPLEELNLSVRAYNCLKRAQVNSVSDLMGFSYEDLLEIKNFGSKSADEVIEALERIGITLPQSRTSA
jgi:multidrug efflux system membrane fusion protein